MQGIHQVQNARPSEFGPWSVSAKSTTTFVRVQEATYSIRFKTRPSELGPWSVSAKSTTTFVRVLSQVSAGNAGIDQAQNASVRIWAVVGFSEIDHEPCLRGL
jgi:hypothetical protein